MKALVIIKAWGLNFSVGIQMARVEVLKRQQLVVFRLFCRPLGWFVQYRVPLYSFCLTTLYPIYTNLESLTSYKSTYSSTDMASSLLGSWPNSIMLFTLSALKCGSR